MVRFITDPDKFEAQPNFYIKIASGKTNSTFTFEDSGACMTENELRELIPNAFDALDSSWFESFTDPDKFKAQPNFYIQIASNKTNSTIPIEDSGIIVTVNVLRELIPNAADALDSS